MTLDQVIFHTVVYTHINL